MENKIKLLIPFCSHELIESFLIQFTSIPLFPLQSVMSKVMFVQSCAHLSLQNFITWKASDHKISFTKFVLLHMFHQLNFFLNHPLGISVSKNWNLKKSLKYQIYWISLIFVKFHQKWKKSSEMDEKLLELVLVFIKHWYFWFLGKAFGL